MSFDGFGDLNWLAVIVAGLAYFALGGIWYAPPVFGNAWMRASGFERPADAEGPGPAIYIAPLLTALISAIAVGLLAQATGTDTASEGLILGLVTGVGIAGTVLATTATFETTKPEPMTWFWITALYHVVGFVIAAVIIGAWQ